MEEIVTYRQRVGAADYISGDKIDVAMLAQKGLLNEDVIAGLRKRKEIVEPTVENMKVALARRPHGAPWPPRGFTEAEMEQRGFIEKKADQKPAEPPAEKKAKTNGKELPPVIERIELKEDAIPVAGNFLQPTKRGNLRFFTAAAPDGRILRATLFRSIENGTAWLEELSTAASQTDTSAEAAEKAEESPDGGDVQSGPDDAEGSGPPEGR
jgi:hypothetical protein